MDQGACLKRTLENGIYHHNATGVQFAVGSDWLIVSQAPSVEGGAGDKPALSAVADYVSAGKPRVECIAWIDGEKSRVVFSSRMPATELAVFQARFEALVQSAVVP
jgi:hypothetical protein